MKIRFMGTAGSEGIPNPFCNCKVCENARKNKGKDERTRASVMVDDCMQIDMSPEWSYQLKREGLTARNVHATLFTHTHPDHFNVPLEELLPAQIIAAGARMSALWWWQSCSMRMRCCIRRQSWPRTPIKKRWNRDRKRRTEKVRLFCIYPVVISDERWALLRLVPRQRREPLLLPRWFRRGRQGSLRSAYRCRRRCRQPSCHSPERRR